MQASNRRQAALSESQRGQQGSLCEFAQVFCKTTTAYCNPSAAAAAAQLCIKRLYAVGDSYTR